MTITKKALLTALVVLVDALALAAILMLPRDGMFDRPLALAALLALALAVGTRSITIPRLGLKVVAADAFVLCALLALAPAATPLVALASMIGVAFSKGSRLLSVQTAFNCGAVPASFAAATGVYLALGGTTGDPASSMLPLLAAAVTHALINVPLTATAVHIATGRSWLELCRNPLGMAIVSNVTSAFMGAGLMLAFVALGPAAFALGLIPLIPLEQYIRSHADRSSGRGAGDSGDDSGRGETHAGPQPSSAPQADTEDPPGLVARTMT